MGKGGKMTPVNPRANYLIAGVPVYAVKSEGGLFYHVTVLETGFKSQSLVKVFEEISVPYVNWSDKVIGVIQDETIVEGE
jgi:hypothetical protein